MHSNGNSRTLLVKIICSVLKKWIYTCCVPSGSSCRCPREMKIQSTQRLCTHVFIALSIIAKTESNPSAHQLVSAWRGGASRQWEAALHWSGPDCGCRNDTDDAEKHRALWKKPGRDAWLLQDSTCDWVQRDRKPDRWWPRGRNRGCLQVGTGNFVGWWKCSKTGLPWWCRNCKHHHLSSVYLKWVIPW